MTFFLVRITAKSHQDLIELDKYHLDLNKRAARQESVDKFVVTGILTDEQIQKLKDDGYILEVLSDLSKDSEERSKEVSRGNRFSQAKKMSDFREGSVGGYMNTDEVETALINLQNAHPELVALIDLPYKTHEGRECKAVKIGKNYNNSENNPSILFTGSMHAREWGGSDICINFLISLIDVYLNNSSLTFGNKVFNPEQIKKIVENLNIFVFPNVNPDGKIYSQKNDDPNLPPGLGGRWWRKNRNPTLVPNGDDPRHKSGVDINRNFDFLWNSGIGTVNKDGSNMSETYRGESSFSEPETKNVKYILDNYDIQYYVDIHSYGELILYSWGNDNNQNVDPSQNFLNPEYDGKRGIVNDDMYREHMKIEDEKILLSLSNKINDSLSMVRNRRYNVQQSVGLYPTSATSDDYVFCRHIFDPSKKNIYGFTIEFGPELYGFIPPFSEMQFIIKEVCAALTELCLAVAEK